MRAERVRHLRQRLAEMLFQHLPVWHVVRHLAQTIHVVGERKQAGLDLVLGEHAKGVANHCGARHLAERADMRQSGRTVTGLEQHLVLRLPFQPRDNGSCLLERPGAGLFGEGAQVGWTGVIGVGSTMYVSVKFAPPKANTPVIASEAKQSSRKWKALDCFVAYAPRNDGDRESHTLKRTDRKIAQPKIGITALFPKPEQRPVEGLAQQIIALAHGNPDAFAEIAAFNKGPARKRATVGRIRAVDPERQ